MSRSPRRLLLILAAGFLAASALLAGPPAKRIADINQKPAVQSFSLFTTLDDVAIFSTRSDDSPEGNLGRLWRTNGTSEGTQSIGSVYINYQKPGVPESVVLRGKVVFIGGTRFVCGGGLYSTDGSEDGTSAIRTFCDGSASGLVKVGERAFFAFRRWFDGNAELWVTDGTTEGTRLVSDLGRSWPQSFTAFGPIVVFVATDVVHGSELWSSDGTPIGTRLVADIWPGPKGSAPQALRNFDGTLYFSAQDHEHGRELWRSDGTAEGTTLVRDIVPGPGSSGGYPWMVSHGVLFLGASVPETGDELWRTDGTAEGTILVADIAPGAASSSAVPLEAFGDILVVTAKTAAMGTELWRIDLATSRPELLRDIRPGPVASKIGGTVRAGDVLYFRADDGVHGAELWRSDGTVAGTHLLADIRPGPEGSGSYGGQNTDEPLVALGGEIVLPADDGVHGYELFAVNTSTGHSHLVRDLEPWTAPSQAWRFVDLGGVAYFGADDGVHGREIWRSDGTHEGTALVADLVPGGGSSTPNYAVVLGDRLVFSSNSLWSARAGSDELTLLSPDPGSGLTVVGDAVWYRGWSPTYGYQLFMTDGTPEGTGLAMVFGTTPNTSGYNGSEPTHLHPAWDGLICSARGYPENGREPWYTSADRSISLAIGDLAPGMADSDPRYFNHLPGSATVWFSALDEEHGRELWRVDDSLVPTLVRDIWPGPGSSDPVYIHPLPDGRVLFTALEPEHGCELWVSDGTSEGTVLLRDIRKVPPAFGWRGPCPSSPVPFNGILYFTVDDAIHGEEMWRTDGTPEGTFIVTDLEPGPEGSSPDDLLAVDGRIVFSASTRAHGRELWVTDGTVSGTRLFQDLRPGAASGDPWSFSTVGDRVFFQAFDEEAGYELWSFKRCRLPGADTLAPEGAITAPSVGACFGPSSVPVVVDDTFADRCDDEVVRTYFPEGGPSYAAHGDVALTLEAADSAGNTTRDARSFTIDLVPPTVTLASPPPLPKSLPQSVPFSLVWTAGDDDGASKEVLREKVYLDGCLLWDGLTYGDGDGLLSDDTLLLGRDELCTLARACGVVELRNPVVRVEAADCGGNVGSASATVTGAFRIPAAMCGL